MNALSFYPIRPKNTTNCFDSNGYRLYRKKS